MDVSWRAQARTRNGKRLPAEGNPRGASQAQVRTVDALERGHSQEPQIGPENERCYIRRKKTSGRLAIGDKKEIDKAAWQKPRGIRLTPTSRYIRDKLFAKHK